MIKKPCLGAACLRLSLAIVMGVLASPQISRAASPAVPQDPFERARQALSKPRPPAPVVLPNQEAPTPAAPQERSNAPSPFSAPPQPTFASPAPTAPPPAKAEGKAEGPPVRITGRIQADFRQHKYTTYTADTSTDRTSGLFDLRRVGVDFRGTVLPARYKISLELANKVELKEAFIDLPVPNVDGRLRLGQFTYPFPAENINSNLFYEFLEAATISDSLSGSKDRGAAFLDKKFEDRLIYMIAIVNGTGAVKPDRNENMDYVIQAQASPFRSADGSMKLWLVGAFATGKRNSTEQEKVEFGPESRSSLVYFTTKLPKESTYTRQRQALEAKFSFNRAVIGGEFLQSTYTVDKPAKITGWYGYLSYMLTDDVRTIEDGFFERQSVSHPVTESGQWGAWELVARYSTFNIDKAFFTDTKLAGDGKALSIEKFATRGVGISVGVNWYLTKQTRVMFDWIQSSAFVFDDGSMTTSETFLAKETALLMRTQIEF